MENGVAHVPESHYKPPKKRDYFPVFMFLFCMFVASGFFATALILNQ